MVSESACPTCNGMGEVIANPCSHCRGEVVCRKRKKSPSRFQGAGPQAGAWRNAANPDAGR
nr:hypothetical protein [Fibrobacter sp. UWR3]